MFQDILDIPLNSQSKKMSPFYSCRSTQFIHILEEKPIRYFGSDDQKNLFVRLGTWTHVHPPLLTFSVFT